MKLLVVTHAPTINNKGKFYSYAPYVNEMDLWFKFGHSVAILSPGTYSEKILEKEFNFQQIKVFRLPFIRIQTILEGIKFSVLLPIILIQFVKAFFWADQIHLRCPGNVGLIGCLIQIFFPLKYKTAKYAGNWDPDARQPFSYRLQKKILSNRWLTRRMTVLVYGEWSGQTRNVKSFFTASFNESEKIRIEKTYKKPCKFLFVGNLAPGKQPLVAAEIVNNLSKKGISAELHFYGDGVMKQKLKEFTGDKKNFFLHGNQPLEVVKEAYKDAHFLILASKSEGWPKAVAEAMFFGCIPIATGVSCVPWMLAAPPAPEGGAKNVIVTERGILLPDFNNRVEKSGNIGKRPEDSKSKEKKLLDTFPKNRQFEWFPKTAKAVSENLSRTGFSETPAYRQGRLEVTSGTSNERQDLIDRTIEILIKLLKDPEEMKRMSMEAQEWSQEYTLEKFEEEIKKLLAPEPPKGEQKRGV